MVSTELVQILFFLCLVVDGLAAPQADKPRSGKAHSKFRERFLRRILEESPFYGNFSNYRPSPEQPAFKVGIVGAGIAGLYSAILLESLGIDYEVLEANTRIGGRIYTHRFDEKKWHQSKPGEPDYYNYYDVGPMRLPDLAWMDRVMGTQNNSLISYINTRVQQEDKVKLIPYAFQANNTFRLYNDKLIMNQFMPSAAAFGVLTSEGGTIAPKSRVATMSPYAALDGALKDLLRALDKDFDTGFNKLMEYDMKSVRQYLTEKGFSTEDIDWLETVNEATEHYDTFSLSQLTLEQWIFDDAPVDRWQCVEGGFDRIVNGLVKILRNPVLTSKRVTGLKPGPDTSVVVLIEGKQQRRYAHVINTPPLGVVQHMDLSGLHLNYQKKLAIRKLRYDQAGKIGMTFKTRWWEKLPAHFKGGQSFTDLPVRRVVYPSYGINTPNAAAAMIASYTWGQDSTRLGAFFNTPSGRKHIVTSVLQDLAKLHNVTYGFLRKQLVDYHLWDWYSHEYSIGAYAMFSPSQFTKTLPPLLQPAYSGRVHFAGEALSAGHGWVIGAVNSAYRSVAEILAVEGMRDKLGQLVDMWGLVDEVDMGWYNQTG